MAWRGATPRVNELLLPVLAELDAAECAVLYGSANVERLVPRAVRRIGWGQAMTYPPAEWRAEYRRCRPEWERRLRDVCRRFDLPNGAFELFSLNLMMASQRVAGCLGFLLRARPAVVLTDYDRNYLSSCLILAARRLRIPTVTLMHGVMEQDAVGFSPVLADTVICWGELDRAKLIAAGEPEGKVVVGGCPRLTRDLCATSPDWRTRLALDQSIRVVVFATSPDSQSRALARHFCAAVESLDSVLGIVRLHPSERLETYRSISRCYPMVRFAENGEATLDESLAAADIVVVRASGVGSDALVKHRPVVVLNPEEVLTGHDFDLVERARCPHARTSVELTEILRRMLLDEHFREEKAMAAERYVADFCGAFGQESACRIANVVTRLAEESAGGHSELGLTERCHADNREWGRSW